MNSSTRRQFTRDDTIGLSISLANVVDINTIPWRTSFSALTNYATCPTLGVIGDSLRLTFNDNDSDDQSEPTREMALEAGSVCHEVYSACRLWQLREQGFRAQFEHHGIRIFGERRFAAMQAQIKDTDRRRSRDNFCLEALYTSGFRDDDRDNRRTFSNIEDTLLDYMMYFDWDRFPVYVLDEEQPDTFVGVEIPIVLKVSASFAWPVAETLLNIPVRKTSDGLGLLEILVVGVLDGVHYDTKPIRHDAATEVIVQENKTASRITTAWIDAWRTDHQITLYLIAASLILGQQLSRVDVYGSPIPLPRHSGIGTTREPAMRNLDDHLPQFIDWLLFGLSMHHMYETRPDAAPRFTHSCGRYYRTCWLMRYCGAPVDERATILQNEMHRRSSNYIVDLMSAYVRMFGDSPNALDIKSLKART